MIDVMVVDDNPIVRAALQGFLAGCDEVRVVAQAGDGQDALALARKHRPGVILLDYRMPVADGLSVIEALAEYSKVLVLTSDGDPKLIAAMLRGGAQGYLVHGEFDPPELLRAVLSVAGGRGWLSPVAASVAVAALRDQVARERAQRHRLERDALARRRFGLTDREREVLELVCRGLSNASIAQQLVLTEKTVKNHLHHVFGKLQVNSRTEAIALWTGR